MTMTRATLFVLTAVGLTVVAARGQVSEYFLMTGDQSMFHVVRGGAMVRSWGPAPGTAQYQYPIAVRDTVRTTGANVGETGAEYDLNGVDLGGRFVHPAPSTRAWDGATDGQSNYLIDTAGGVYRLGLDWSDPVLLFDLNDFGGITYDPSNDSLWISQWGRSTITNYTFDGQVISSFDAGHSRNMALAMDYADGTLWLHDRNAQGTLEQWSRSGQLLDRIAVPGLASQNVLGGEFQFGGGCGDKAKLKAVCKQGGTKVAGKLKKADANTAVTFRLDGGQAIQAVTNNQGKAKAKWRNQEAGPHSVTVCDLEKRC